MILWFSKKQALVVFYIVEAKYIVARTLCTQILWIKEILKDYDIKSNKVFIRCDNISGINLAKNLIQHSRASILKLNIILLEIIYKIMILCSILFLLENNLLTFLLNFCVKIDFIWLKRIRTL